jgi:hypothetical protein
MKKSSYKEVEKEIDPFLDKYVSFLCFDGMGSERECESFLEYKKIKNDTIRKHGWTPKEYEIYTMKKAQKVLSGKKYDLSPEHFEAWASQIEEME